MARRKTLPDLVKTKYSLAERLSRLRAELFGERGGPELARRLGIPVRTWYNYEAGVTVPAEVVLKIIELTSVEPMWLLHGKGPKFRPKPVEDFELVPSSKRSVGSLLRTALRILEQAEPAKKGRRGRSGGADGQVGEVEPGEMVLIEVTDEIQEPLTDASDPRYLAARAEWDEAERDDRCVRQTGEAMAPVVVDGAQVAFSGEEEEFAELGDRLVVAWVDGEPLIRWFKIRGRHGQLRAENAEADGLQVRIDLEDPDPDFQVRRVCWISVPQ
jgi:hypothetical protein